MDANATRFHLLLSEEDWGRCVQDGTTLADAWRASPPGTGQADVDWDLSAQALALRARLFRFVPAPKDLAPARDSRRGAAADRFGNIYWIDADARQIRVRSVGSEVPSDFWSQASIAAPAQHGDFADMIARDIAVRELRGLAVTQDHYLVCGTVSPAGLLIFDLFAGSAPTYLLWPAAVPFVPFDIAARPRGGVWILDRDNQRYWGLDRRFRVISAEDDRVVIEPAHEDTFQPLEANAPRGRSERRFPAGLSYAAASPVEAIDAVAIEALPDGSVLILDRDEAQRFSRVLHYRCAQRVSEPVSLQSMAVQIEEGENVDFTLIAHDFVYLPAAEGESAQLMFASAEGNQAFAFAVSHADEALQLKPLAKYFPMRRFGGKGLVVSGGSVYYDFGDTWVPLTVQRRPRYATAAHLETRPDGFDSGEPDCVWHRLTLDACIPPETAVQIYSRAANSAAELQATEWQREPDLYCRGDGSELPWIMPRASRGPSTAHHFATHELLLQNAQGRFLQLALALSGDERSTPKLQALRIWYPRFSYSQQYLPAVYREEPDSASFLERFLANLEGVYTALEDKIAEVRGLFHWQSAPPDALRWLAGWFGAALDPAWDEARRRLFIGHAVDFFQYRGTMHGLRMALSLALDPSACEAIFAPPGTLPEARQRYRIIERYRTRITPPGVLGEPLRDTGPREVEVKARWQSREGLDRLTQRYREYLEAAGVKPEVAASAVFTLVQPRSKAGQGPPESAAFWEPFAREILGFVPAAAEERSRWQSMLASQYAGDIAAIRADLGVAYDDFQDIPLPADMPTAGKVLAAWKAFVALREIPDSGHERHLWQDFLARRYGHIAALNQVWHTQWQSFELVSLLDVLPAVGLALDDWYQFETVVKVMHRHAHRFSVLVPSSGPNADLEEIQQRLALAQRVVDLEKPAHTVFDLAFYWALFRIGDARLGFDTLIDVGSRAPDLLPEIVLGRYFIGASQLALSNVRPQDQRMSLDCLTVGT